VGDTLSTSFQLKRAKTVCPALKLWSSRASNWLLVSVASML
jgi:hypothetical protein